MRFRTAGQVGAPIAAGRWNNQVVVDDPSKLLEVLGQTRHWLWTLERELDRLEDVRMKGIRVMSEGSGRYTEAAGRAFSEESATEHWVVVAAHHLATVIGSRHLRSEYVSEELRTAVPKDLAERIQVLRNLKEHDEEHRFGNWEEIKQAARTRERHERLSDGPLWTSRWTPLDGTTLDGLVGTSELREVCERVAAAMPDDPREQSEPR